MSVLVVSWVKRFEQLFAEAAGAQGLSRAEYIAVMDEVESIAATNAEAAREDDRREGSS